MDPQVLTDQMVRFVYFHLRSPRPENANEDMDVDPQLKESVGSPTSESLTISAKTPEMPLALKDLFETDEEAIVCIVFQQVSP